MQLGVRFLAFTRHLSECPSPPKEATEEELAVSRQMTQLSDSLKRTEFRVTFFGAFKAGKSTLLNALLGWPLLPSRVNRATGVITTISHGSSPAASIIRCGTGTPQKPEAIFFDELSRYILLELNETTAKAPAGIEEVHIQLPLSLLGNNITLVDTPGLMDNATLTANTLCQIEQADLAVMILSADKMVSQSEREVAQYAHQLLGGNLVFIINRLDLIDEDEHEEIIEWASSAFVGLGNPQVGQPRIFATEAKSTLEARKKGLPVATLHQGLVDFEKWLLEKAEVSESLALPSRLSRLDKMLENNLAKVQLLVEKTHTEVKNLQGEAAKTQSAQQANFNRDIQECTQRLTQLRDTLPQFEHKLAEKCRWEACKLVGFDQNWAARLSLSFEPLIRDFAHEVEWEAKVAIGQKTLSIASFKPRQFLDIYDKPIPSPSPNPLEGVDSWLNETFGSKAPKIGAFGASLGDWFNQNLGGEKYRPDPTASVEEAIAKLLATLRIDATEYLYRVARLLADYVELYRPKTQPVTIPKLLQNRLDYLQNLLGWLRLTKHEVERLRDGLK